ncbi:alpha/beta hydrolase [Paracoccus sp. (in: a-proteobacteria)]|uniref:PHA/PHB synthase family protein n=1 Tax=Paracoccus sp. TaxID=267 RepID=UPI0026E0176D|nr:alpha/beta fold hydrolase [Paracoccus sp. (in: a-proteobacteria)]MDO5648252.1 alpha/beta fold hydrolase [Paracoccus sp. (in: a-proteobacteria)]
MDTKWTEAVSSMMKNAAETHPAFRAMDAQQMQAMTDNFQKSLQAFAMPSAAAVKAWTDSWLAYQREMAKLWMTPVSGIEPSRDVRFKADEWASGIYPFLRQSYELTARAMAEIADNAGLPDHEQRKFSFYTRLAADAMSPSNFLHLNPEVLKLAQETNGQSLVEGFQNLLADLKKGYITTTDETAFKVGENLATTPGAVVFRNDLIELIQYTPVTPQIRSNPIVIVPPCVNKFYIFDINEKKSMIRYLLEQGNQVFIVSWRNPGADMTDYGWDEYIEQGIFTALDVAGDIMKSDKVDLLSWCNGGSMSVAALAIMTDAQKKKIGSATFMSSLIDFTDPGELGVFFDQPQVDAYNTRLKTVKLAPGRDIARAMAMLHVNESIWGFVIGNYLKGKAPTPFDILYWNADTSNLPAKWYSTFAEDMYVKNKLREPGGLTFLGRSVDVRNIDVPVCFVAATGDHIVPWTTSYISSHLVTGQPEFILTTGGHVSGTVINHPAKTRHSFWTGDTTIDDPQEWKDSATKTEGSWWPHWLNWVEQASGGDTRSKPSSLGSRKYKELDAAPGTYVLEERAQDGK